MQLEILFMEIKSINLNNTDKAINKNLMLHSYQIRFQD